MVEKLIKLYKRTNYVYSYCKPITGRIYTDKSGPVLIPPYSGMKYVMVLYDFDSNIIWATAIPYKTKLQLVTSYKLLFSLIQQKVLQPQMQHLKRQPKLRRQ